MNAIVLRSKIISNHDFPSGNNCCALRNHGGAKHHNCFPYLFFQKRYKEKIKKRYKEKISKT
jgi:hypothetical protein